jgi:hypothetical protein
MLIVLKVMFDAASACWSCEGYVRSMISSARLELGRRKRLMISGGQSLVEQEYA